MTPPPILVRDRRSGRTLQERVFGGRALAWACLTPTGRLFTAAIGRRHWFSALYGLYARSSVSRGRIAPFIRDFAIDTSEMADDPASFRSFNDFFTRRLRPGARPVAPDPATVAFPADGRHLAIQDIDAADGWIIKGHRFDLATLLGSTDLARSFTRGSLLISRLCPVDYHRFHFPLAGTPHPHIPLPGPLLSVNPLALRLNPASLARNHRHLTLLDAPAAGTIALVEIGATMVGSIHQSFQPGRPVAKGDEKGWFAFGGSCTATLFPHGSIQFDDDLLAASASHLESFALTGTACARLTLRRS